MKPLPIIKYQLYLLQLENYELGRYFKLLWQKGLWPKGEQRKSLVWTKKALAVFIFALAFNLFLPFLLYWFLSGRLSVASIKYQVLSFALFLLLATCYFLLFSLAVILLWPIDWAVKQVIIARAKARVKNLPDLKIIGIAGSYGKTTMKEVLNSVLSIKYKASSTPESVNTPVGIARWILNKVTDETQIIIVEMGEHYSGDIGDVCKIARPDIAVVTGINESHLERMKNMDTVISTVFEIVSGAKPGAMVILNGDDDNVINHYKKYIWPDNVIERFKIEDLSIRTFNAQELYWESEAKNIGKIKVNLLGEYGLADVDAAIKIAKHLGMADEEIKKGITKIRPVEHRLQPIKSAGNVLVIDDAYNGNPEGVKEAIKVLSRFTDRRKIYITPGLVEMGKASKEVHLEIGRQLAEAADVIILVKNSVTPWIEEGIKASVIARSAADEAILSEGEIAAPSDALGLAMTQILWFTTAQEAHAALPKILKPGDVVLFQNDWGDQYL